MKTATPKDERHVEIATHVAYGLTARVFLHEKARVLPEYSAPVQSAEAGVSSDDKIISINSAGRWLFGVPGFDGHLRVVPTDKILTLYFPENAPEEVRALISALKAAIE